jgi:alpha-galactosidase
MLQYVNPMAINCWALAKLAPDIAHVGLCHSVQGTAYELAQDLGESHKDIRYHCAGINHMSFYTRFEKEHPDGTREDLYPRLKAIAAEGRAPEANRVRYEILRRTGYFVTESSEHFAEYVPWFIKRDRPDLIKEFNVPLDEYIRRCEDQIAAWDAQERELTNAEQIDVNFSGEYGARIIRAVATDRPTTINGNVANRGLIDNLPEGACVEVPCQIDASGVSPMPAGALPPHLAALMQTNINVQALTVEALATGKREHVYHAAMLDPHVGAELSLDQIWHMVDDLIEAHGEWLPPLN